MQKIFWGIDAKIIKSIILKNITTIKNNYRDFSANQVMFSYYNRQEYSFYYNKIKILNVCINID